MKTLSKFDVFLYFTQAKDTKELISIIHRNAFFENVSERIIRLRLNELRKDGFAADGKMNMENPDTINCLAFLHWMRMREIDYNRLLEKRVVNTFTAILGHSNISIKSLVKKTRLSRPTILNIANLLKEHGFIRVNKRKPLLISANLNDKTFFYINFLKPSLKPFEEGFVMPRFPVIHSKKLEDRLIKLHIYSTTVTEGNTATEDDVKRVLENNPVKLTPREVTEILNAREAIRYTYKICKKEVNIAEIENIHRILMNNLLETAGKFYYGRKRIIGSETKLPNYKEAIDYSMTALLNFQKEYEKKINPMIMAPIIHFIFVTIHPFADGNGRTARLMHSWILLKANMTLFVFDPDKRNTYFDLLENSRKEDIEKFIDFCLNEHADCIRRLRATL